MSGPLSVLVELSVLLPLTRGGNDRSAKACNAQNTVQLLVYGKFIEGPKYGF